MLKLQFLISFTTINLLITAQIYIPVNSYNRQSIKSIQITEIGKFGEWRKERVGIPGHYHTGIDIKRNKKFNENEPVYAITKGIVISLRDDGPYAQIIIVYEIDGNTFWTVYEHISGIVVDLGYEVEPFTPIARFMNTKELNKYGWQFNHLHFEIMKTEPLQLKKDLNNSKRLYNNYSLICYTKELLYNYYFAPIEFFNEHIK